MINENDRNLHIEGRLKDTKKIREELEHIQELRTDIRRKSTGSEKNYNRTNKDVDKLLMKKLNTRIEGEESAHEV